MDINLFDFYLPEELIAQRPTDKRDQSRLLTVNLSDKTYADKHFYEIIDYLKQGDVVIIRYAEQLYPGFSGDILVSTHIADRYMKLDDYKKRKRKALTAFQ